jgi:maleamate amidohydrolase
MDGRSPTSRRNRRSGPLCDTVKGDGGVLGSLMDKPGAQDFPIEVAAPEGSLVMSKPKASAFFCTSLPTYPLRHRVDSLIVTGATTSGCVRATVVDAHSHSIPVFVVDDACFDRSRLGHGVNLYEMNAKYADVLTADALEELTRASARPTRRSSDAEPECASGRR